MIGTVLYNLFIMPWELIFEVIFWFLKDKPALAIFAISIVMNFLALPLYKRADAIQSAERDKAASMAGWVSHIKKTFKGDERYMMLTTYYRQQNYKPIYSLRSTFPLLLQVPFFMAAYNYLSNLTLLKGASFLFLKDLGAPDQLITLGSFQINVMPIVMTLINVVSAYIYLRGFPIKDKIQTYGIAVIFLVLLYNSPSGLVFYWTLNQIFSVMKNVFMKLVKSRKVRNIFFSVAGIVVFIVLIASGIMTTPKKTVLCILILLICQIPMISTLIEEKGKGRIHAGKPMKISTFLLGSVFITILLGIVIPMSVISSSPGEFVTKATSPFSLVLNNFCIYAGFFIVWLGIYYYMSGTFMRNIFTYAMWVLSGAFMVDYLLFSKNLGVMNSYLVFNNMPYYTGSEKLINLLVILILAVVLVLIMRYFSKFVRYIYIILIAGSMVMAGISIFSSISAINARNAVTKTASENAGEISDVQETDNPSSEKVSVTDTSRDKIIPFSTNGRNVIVIMLDRAIGSYLPYIFHEKPELERKFAGFTYYPNTVSFGGHTNYGAPPIFGGYEYTPQKTNERSDMLLVDKHDEALLVMPAIFSAEGYHVTVCDPPYAGYETYPPDLSIYDGMENVDAKITFYYYADELIEEFSVSIRKTQKRNFFFYSLMRAVPTVFQNTVYNEGNYYSTLGSDALTCSDEFIYAYSALYNLPELTEVTDSDEDTLLLFKNDTTHANTILQTPEYVPSVKITSDMYANKGRFTLDGKTAVMDTEYQISHYHVNMAAYIQLGDWFDYLREMGVYDNSRIVIVSDHGNGIGQFEDLLIADDWDAEWVNCLLMFKDFGETEFKTSYEYMTNADVPMLTMDGLIEDPVNPFTGNEFSSDVDKESYLITSSHNWDVKENNGTVFDTSDGSWWKVHGDIYDAEKWERVE